MPQFTMRVEATGKTKGKAALRADRAGIHRVLTCAHCRAEITDHAHVYLLRDAYALPEEPTYYLHAGCIDLFTAEHPARWVRIPLSSPEAAWCL